MPALPPSMPPFVPRKKGLSTGAWVAIVAAVVVLILGGVGVLALAGFTGAKSAIQRAKKVSALAMATDLENSINEFYNEYGALPNPETWILSHDIVFDTSDPDGQRLLSILMSKEPGPAPQNSMKILYLTPRNGKGGKGGLIPLPSGLSELRDPWGNPYQVILDGDYDEVLTPPASSGTAAPVKGRRVLVYSLGRDGKGGIESVRTW
ncbi:MAG: hypothetical protein CFE26_08980 [Verrucomicrobiales bacterium VVV1]|nr:MAG: hypothetical protein CFE26_08980 [Verrucomicrobiales bacterium VVV1]